MFSSLSSLVVTAAALAVWAAYVTGVHVFAGARRVLAPMVRAEMPAFARGTAVVVWHVVSWVLASIAVATAAAAFVPGGRALLAFAAVLAGGSTVIFVRGAKTSLGGAIRLPQWMLLGPLAVGLAAAAFVPDHAAGVAVGLLLALVSAAHVAWAFGASWPARDAAELAAHVLPADAKRARTPTLPSRAATLAVAVVLAFMAVSIVVVRSPWPAVTIGGLFAARGLFGLIYPAWARTRGPFGVYNRIMYSPACLLVATLAFIVVAVP